MRIHSSAMPAEHAEELSLDAMLIITSNLCGHLRSRQIYIFTRRVVKGSEKFLGVLLGHSASLIKIFHSIGDDSLGQSACITKSLFKDEILLLATKFGILRKSVFGWTNDLCGSKLG